MDGRSFQTVTSENGRPSWIGYVGLQLLLGPKEAKPRVNEKVPRSDGCSALRSASQCGRFEAQSRMARESWARSPE